LPLALQQACALATSGRPGPVHIDVPLNVFVEPVPQAAIDAAPAAAPEWMRPAASAEALAAALALLDDAKNPVIVAGHGVELSAAEADLQRLAETFALPVATSPFGKGVIDAMHPLSLGPTGRNGSYAANAACRNADVILAFGTRFDDRSTSAWLK